MPLLLTPTAPFQTSTCLETPCAYALIDEVRYNRHTKEIACLVGYYASEAACVAKAAPLLIRDLPARFTQQVSPEQANAVPIFEFLEGLLTAQLTALLPGATIETVA